MNISAVQLVIRIINGVYIICVTGLEVIRALFPVGRRIQILICCHLHRVRIDILHLYFHNNGSSCLCPLGNQGDIVGDINFCATLNQITTVFNFPAKESIVSFAGFIAGNGIIANCYCLRFRHLSQAAAIGIIGYCNLCRYILSIEIVNFILRHTFRYGKIRFRCAILAFAICIPAIKLVLNVLVLFSLLNIRLWNHARRFDCRRRNRRAIITAAGLLDIEVIADQRGACYGNIHINMVAQIPACQVVLTGFRRLFDIIVRRTVRIPDLIISVRNSNLVRRDLINLCDLTLYFILVGRRDNAIIYPRSDILVRAEMQIGRVNRAGSDKEERPVILTCHIFARTHRVKIGSCHPPLSWLYDNRKRLTILGPTFIPGMLNFSGAGPSAYVSCRII